MVTFKTSDGYILTLFNGVWTDGDMVFQSVKGYPVDCFDEQIPGVFLGK
jgi:hypothetical protein